MVMCLKLLCGYLLCLLSDSRSKEPVILKQLWSCIPHEYQDDCEVWGAQDIKVPTSLPASVSKVYILLLQPIGKAPLQQKSVPKYQPMSKVGLRSDTRSYRKY